MKATIFAAAAAWLMTAVASAAPVETEYGLVEGTAEHGLRVYRGIPFATPPVGDLRWRGPQPAAKWPGVRTADKFGPSCMQPSGPNPLLGTPALTVSEDCLYLNVWTPARSPDEKLPVLVWIYGGGFQSGSTALPIYSGENLAKRGVVLVSIAYRVGAMGFFAHPGLSAESKHRVSGNYGLLDQIAGLQWVQKNIAAFGGDPRRVTVFGESVGGISVSMLAASPQAKGLFAGAISQSGGSFGPTRSPPEPGENIPTLATAEADGAAVAKRLNAATVADLRKLPPEAIAQHYGTLGMAWPTLDGWLITDDQYKLYSAGRYNDTPILVGTNSDEGALFPIQPTREAYVAHVHKRFGPHAEALLKLYPPSDHWQQSNRDITRDAAFAWHTWAWANLQARQDKSKVFLYYFDHSPPRTERSRFRNAAGAVHAEEIVYVFQQLDRQPLPWTPQDRAVSDAMAAYWTNFAKRGDPNGDGVPAWPAYTSAAPVMMHFDDVPKPGAVANLEGLKALDAYFAWRRTPQGQKLAQRH